MSHRDLIHIPPECDHESELFDYGSLPTSIRTHVEEETRVIRDLLARTASHIVQIGLRLQLVREQIGRDQFQQWLHAEFRWSRSVASKYMCAARAFQNEGHLSNLQPSALYVLARKKVPPAARDEALRLAADGEIISKHRAEVIAEKYTAPDATARNELGRLRQYVHAAAERLSPSERRRFARELMRLAEAISQRDTSEKEVPSRPTKGSRSRRSVRENTGKDIDLLDDARD